MTRVYLKPGDIVNVSMVDLVVTEKKKNVIGLGYTLNYIDSKAEKKNVIGLGYALSHIDSEAEIKYFSDKIMNDERDYGYPVKYAWDLDEDDEHYGAPYYEEKEE